MTFPRRHSTSINQNSLCASGSVIDKYLLSIYYVPGILLDTGDMAVNETNKIPTLKEFKYNERQIINNQ